MIAGRDLPMHNGIDTNSDGSLTVGTISASSPWIRVGEVPFKITNLAATADAMDRITIDYPKSGSSSSPRRPSPCNRNYLQKQRLSPRG
jgi:hypothetical protein